MPVDGRDGDEALAASYRPRRRARRAGPRDQPVLGIGVGTPGLVDAATGTIRWAVNLDWQDLPLGRHPHRAHRPAGQRRQRLARRGPRRVPVRRGRRRAPNLVAIKVGRGIGAGIVLGGELFQGDGFGAGEIGHTVVVDDGAECRCGRFGCLETVASSRAIVRAATEAANDAPDCGSGGASRVATGTLTLDDVAQALDAGDEAARRVVVAAGRWLGQSVAALIGALDISRIVLLGSVDRPSASRGSTRSATRPRAARSRLLADDTRIEIGRPVDNVVILGAAALLMTRELGLVPTR